jgi:hypothetical protein
MSDGSNGSSTQCNLSERERHGMPEGFGEIDSPLGKGFPFSIQQEAQSLPSPVQLRL